MKMRAFSIAGLASLLFLAYAATASASTLGITAQPNPSSPNSCTEPPLVGQATSAASTPYTVPAGGGTITQWQTVTTDDVAGSSLEFVVLRPVSGGYTVVGVDTETLPSPLPVGGVASFTVATPIAVDAGDTFALYSSEAGDVCYFTGGSTPAGDTLNALDDSSLPPSVGQTVAPTGPGSSPGGYTLNLAATLVQTEDVGVTTTAGPSGAAAGRPALLSSTVTNGGPGTDPVTFVDHVPAGLQINSATAGDGTCSTSGQTVTCTISGLPAGQNVPVDVVVTPTAAGKYANGVTVALRASLTDPNSANNTASATLEVGPAAPNPTCLVPKLKNTPSSVAKTVLKDLGCKVKLKRSHSSAVPKGLVIKTKPGKGRYSYRKAVTLVVSSGPKKSKQHR
jgi:hypothetical protein